MNKTIMIKNYLKENKKITSLDAINLCTATRLSAIIYNLRADGWEIDTEMVDGKDQFGHPMKYGVYHLVSMPDEN